MNMSGQASCSFCNEEFESVKAMEEHLMICGNKTEQCPTCRKYVRRAIFAYHYENNCANLDALTTDDQPAPHSGGALITITCPDCKQNYNRTDRKTHKKNCPYNPANRSNNQQPFNNENFNANPNRSRQSNESDDDARIPCEYCNKGISWHLYEDHTKACREEYQREQQRARRNNQATMPVPVTTTVPSTGMCVFCRNKGPLVGLFYHQLCCKMNPRRNGCH